MYDGFIFAWARRHLSQPGTAGQNGNGPGAEGIGAVSRLVQIVPGRGKPRPGWDIT